LENEERGREGGREGEGERERERERDSDGGEETRGKLELLSMEAMRHQPLLTTISPQPLPFSWSSSSKKTFILLLFSQNHYTLNFAKQE
jgi:hypothetical protein